VKKVWLWVSAFAALLLACALAGWFRAPEVSVRIKDHRLSIYEARMWHCNPSAGPTNVMFVEDYPKLRWLDFKRCYYMRSPNHVARAGVASRECAPEFCGFNPAKRLLRFPCFLPTKPCVVRFTADRV
jgi:hypothetical protein